MKLDKYITKNGYEFYLILNKCCNVFFLTNGKTNIIIDSNRKKNRKLLNNSFSKFGIIKVDYLFLTHSHFDHVENARYIKNKFNAKVIIHKSEANLLSDGYTPLPEGTVLPTKLIIKLIGKRIQHRFEYEPCVPDITFEEKFDLNDYGYNGFLLHTPGHTSGSSCLILDDEICVAGDSMFGIFRNSIFPPYANDVKQLVLSWNKLLDTKCKLFIPSHGTPRTREVVQKCFREKAKKLGLI